MSINLHIDDKLILTAQNIGKRKTKKDTVTQALKQYIEHHQQPEIVSLFGTIDYDYDYDYKKQREKE